MFSTFLILVKRETSLRVTVIKIWSGDMGVSLNVGELGQFTVSYFLISRLLS